MKRFVDIVGATVGLFLLGPLLLVTCLFVSQDFKSPIFVARRVGLNGQEFFMYKLRSMVIDAPNKEVIQQATMTQDYSGGFVNT